MRTLFQGGTDLAKLVPACAVLLLAVLVWSEAGSTRDAKLIERAKALSVTKLDSSLPDLSFDQWLRTEAGADAQYRWEVNDCGEQTGTPGQNPSEIPTCVEADAMLKDKREIIIMVSIQDANDTKAAKTPPVFAVFFAQLITPHETINIKQLSDLPAALVRTHKPTSNPEIAK